MLATASRGPQPRRRVGRLTAALAGAMLGVCCPLAMAQPLEVVEVWRANQDFDGAADTATIVETTAILIDTAVISVGTVTDATSGRTQIVIYFYKDNGGSATLLDHYTIPESGDPSEWHDLDFVATDAHVAGTGLAVCGYAVDPTTGHEVGVAACYKMLASPPLTRTWVRLLDDVEESSRATALDSSTSNVAVTGWIDSETSEGRNYLTWLLAGIDGSALSGWPKQYHRSETDEAVAVALFDQVSIPSFGELFGPDEPRPLTEERLVVTGTTHPSATKADMTTVGYDLFGAQKWQRTFEGKFGSVEAHDVAMAMSSALWKVESSQEFWGVYVSGNSSTQGDIPFFGDIITLSWNVMDGLPIWPAQTTGSPFGVRRYDSTNGEDRAFANGVALPFEGSTGLDHIGLWVAGSTPNPDFDGSVDFLALRYDLETGAEPSSGWPVVVQGGGGEDDVALAVGVQPHSNPFFDEVVARVTGFGWSDTSTSIDFMTISLDGFGDFTADGYPIFLDESGEGTDVAVSVIRHPLLASEDDYFVLGTTTRSGSPPLDITTVKYRDEEQ